MPGTGSWEMRQMEQLENAHDELAEDEPVGETSQQEELKPSEAERKLSEPAFCVWEK
jgi:hypothetical protein